jgi:hypothetical protein
MTGLVVDCLYSFLKLHLFPGIEVERDLSDSGKSEFSSQKKGVHQAGKNNKYSSHKTETLKELSRVL